MWYVWSLHVYLASVFVASVRSSLAALCAWIHQFIGSLIHCLIDSTMAIVPTSAVEDLSNEQSERAKANPTVGVGDLERAICLFFDEDQFELRSFDGIQAAIEQSGLGWKTGSKALSGVS